jgi:hypothetical protein
MRLGNTDMIKCGRPAKYYYTYGATKQFPVCEKHAEQLRRWKLKGLRKIKLTLIKKGDQLCKQTIPKDIIEGVDKK